MLFFTVICESGKTYNREMMKNRGLMDISIPCEDKDIQRVSVSLGGFNSKNTENKAYNRNNPT